MTENDVLPSVDNFKKLNKVQIVFQDFRGQSLEKALDYLNSFDWTGKDIISIDSINRHGTHIIRVWFR